MAPPEIWLSGPPPFPYFTLGSHPSGVAAAAGGWREGMAPAFVPGRLSCQDVQHHVGKGPSSSVSFGRAVPPSCHG